MANKKCCDGFNQAGGCTVHSKIKMVVQLKPEYKKMDRSPTFYSWVYQNKKADTDIIQGMLLRLVKYYTNQYNVIEFYKQGIDEPIHTVKP